MDPNGNDYENGCKFVQRNPRRADHKPPDDSALGKHEPARIPQFYFVNTEILQERDLVQYVVIVRVILELPNFSQPAPEGTPLHSYFGKLPDFSITAKVGKPGFHACTLGPPDTHTVRSNPSIYGGP